MSLPPDRDREAAQSAWTVVESSASWNRSAHPLAEGAGRMAPSRSRARGSGRVTSVRSTLPGAGYDVPVTVRTYSGEKGPKGGDHCRRGGDGEG